MRGQAEGKDVCVTGDGPNNAPVMVVTRSPVSQRSRSELMEYFHEVGLDPGKVMWTSAMKCRVWDAQPTKTDQKACRKYLQAEIEHVQPGHIIALGGEALFAATGKSGIMKYRGQLTTLNYGNGVVVFPTISPAMIARNPGLRDGFIADLRYFKRLVSGEANLTPAFHTNAGHATTVDTKAALRSLVEALHRAGVVAYDIETTGAAEHEPGAAIVSIALTLSSGVDMTDAHTWKVPLFHPQSPWRNAWRTIIRILRAMARVPKRVAHNAKFDTRWLIEFGMDDLLPTFDTIIAASLLDENRAKGLKPLAQQLLGADPWGIDTKNLLTTPLDQVLDYNGLDTWHTLRLYYLFRDQLKAQPRLGRLFVHLMMPAIRELIPTERRGVYVDREVLATNHHIAKTTLTGIEEKLKGFVPPAIEWPVTIKELNFNASNFARWWLFDHMKFPVLARGKTKDDGGDGAPSMAEAIMLELADREDQRLQETPDEWPTDNVPKLMLDRALWYKRVTGFYEPYEEILDANSRIHTTFKPWGTVTGRLSSGKEDQEKITGKATLRGVNLQQVPRDPIVRGVFGAQPGWSFVEADYSQIELRVAAFLSRDDEMLRLYATGQDIHMAMAMRMTGKPAHMVTKEERKKAKAVNFGFLYGMGWRKFIETAWSTYQVRVTEAEARAFRTAFFDQFPKLPPWHAKQRRLATKYGRVESPIGRVRHLPDVQSPLDEVRSEAERQAINSPVQGFASDMALLSLVLCGKAFRDNGLQAHPIGTVHDAVNFEIHDDDLHRALPIIKDTMENLPLERLFGVRLDVPIVADIKVGRHWGGAKEIAPADIYNWNGRAA
jgi:DNA polymerase-1